MSKSELERSAIHAGSAVEEVLGGREVFVVSNREPYSHEYDDESVTVSRPAGGLTAALDPVMRALDGTWIAWGSGDADRAVVDEHDRVRVPPEDPAYGLRRVWLDDEDLAGYYYGFSNQVLWPLCHGLPSKVNYERSFWDTYRAVNDTFASAVVEEVGGEERAIEEPIVWFQDYHLGLAPRLVRDRLGDDPTLLHFWHVPWPPWDVFRRCPHGPELLTALLSNDVVGFHTDLDRRQFVECATRDVGATYDVEAGVLEFDGRKVRVVTAPIGIDVDAVAHRAASDTATEFWDTFARDHGLTDVTVALGVDRLDYTKGIPERLDAFERLLETDPGLRNDLTLVQKGSESRSRIDAYRDLQRTVRERVDAINERFGTEDWQPVVFTTDHLDRAELAALYRNADVALVSPIRDGLNLVAKEFVAAQGEDPGALVLSEAAGVATELGEDALAVRPLDTASFAETIRRAIDMPSGERRERMEGLTDVVTGTDATDWIERVFEPIGTDSREDQLASEGVHASGD